MNFIDFLESIDRSGILLIKKFCLASYQSKVVIFVFPGVDLYNRILISSQNSDLGFSTSSTMRPKLQRPWGRPRMDLGGWNLAWDLRVGPYSKYVWGKAVQAFSKNSARPIIQCEWGPFSWFLVNPTPSLSTKFYEEELLLSYRDLVRCFLNESSFASSVRTLNQVLSRWSVSARV